MVRLRADRDREEARARGRERPAEALDELLGRDLPRGRDPVPDVDHGRLLLAVDAAEGDVEERAEVGRAARRVLGQLLHRGGDLLL